MSVLETWLTVLVLGWLAMMSPGPNFAMTLRNSLLRSREAGVFTVLGIALGGLFHISYSLIGVSLLLARSETLFMALKWAGAAYLVYIGIRAVLTRGSEITVEGGATQPMSRAEALRSGFLTCLLNPKSLLFFFAIFTQVVQPDTPLFARLLIAGTITFEQLTWYGSVALFFSHKGVRSFFARAALWLERTTGAAMILLGIRLALTQS